MKLIKRLTDLILAQRIFLHNIHLLSISNGDHKLAEELEDDLMDFVDDVKEISLYVYPNQESIAYANETAQGALDILKQIPSQPLPIDELFSYSLQIFEEIIKTSYEIDVQETNNIQSFGLRNLVQDIAEQCSKKGYRLKQRLKEER